MDHISKHRSYMYPWGLLKHFRITIGGHTKHRSHMNPWGLSRHSRITLGDPLRTNSKIYEIKPSITEFFKQVNHFALSQDSCLGGREPSILSQGLGALQKDQSHIFITSPCPKTRAWGAVNRHNIPKGLKALQKGSKPSRMAHLKAPPFLASRNL